MQSTEIRTRFFEFFKEHGHTLVPSSPLIPAQDPTLLFTNAGMNQFKDLFLGLEQRSYKRAVSIQKCMRAGGKHNDLDNVGFTSRHLTFFEMMGNFSFGDYFKKEAIEFAWNFLVERLGFDATKLYATVFEKDDEAYDLWRNVIGLPEDRVFRLGAKDNFWQMGDTGPCGPCSEILVDRGSSFGCGAPTCSPSCPCGERFLEVWNLVFMEFDRQSDGTDKRLIRVGVDTGMGLERLCVIMQDKKNVFQTDLFKPLMQKIEQCVGLSYNNVSADNEAVFNVVAEHTRAATFLIADGCSPSNEGRGYVLRKIIRRAALFAQKITEENILPELSGVVIDTMASVYPDLIIHRESIAKLLSAEVAQFSTNLVQGRSILENYFKRHEQNPIVEGEVAFKLYDTHGFPVELTRVVAREHNFSVDETGFEERMEQQRQQSGKKTVTKTVVVLPEGLRTEFVGYELLEIASSVAAIIEHDKIVEQVAAGSECWIVPGATPFFVACGGQVADQGSVNFKDTAPVPLLDLKKIDHAIALKIIAPVLIKTGDIVGQKVNQEIRWRTMKNHTATHLLQSALIKVLGNQVRQAGSLVNPDYLRFDFTYCEQMTSAEINKVEEIVNRKIMENIPVDISITTFKKAIDKGVMAIFGEKYNPESVRVIDVPGFSAELCGGTHVLATGDIGVFKITHVSALSAGQRRIVALTGPGAVELFQQTFATVQALSSQFKVKQDQVLTTIEKQTQQLHEAQVSVRQAKKRVWQDRIPQWVSSIKFLNALPFLYQYIPDQTALELKEIVNSLAVNADAFYFLVSGDQTKTVYYALLSPKVKDALNLTALSLWLKANFSLSGGVKAPALQGGGPWIDVQKLDQALQEWLKGHHTL